MMQKTLDFPTYFTTLRDNMERTLDPSFQTVRNVSVNDRLTALHAWFDSLAEQKLLGVIPIGGSTLHSHEHRLLFSVPRFDRTALDDWWNYALALQKTLVHPDPSHQFSLISLILVCGSCEPAALRRLTWRSSSVNYHSPQSGWSEIRFAVIDASTGKISANRAAAPLVTLLRPVQP